MFDERFANYRFRPAITGALVIASVLLLAVGR